ncbi:MAG TPA: thioredoxin domain-containing protein, partial [Ktedonobacteraceae bacterium]
YDQLGGGFHRYSVDAQWLVPHFEKMLYDNALLSRVYLHAYLVTGNPFYRRIVEETLDYVVREMTSPEGAFYSTQDADSEGEEGKFFVWTPAEIEAVLSPRDAALFIQYFDVSQKGNFEGKNILHVSRDVEEVAKEAKVTTKRVQDSLQQSRAQLFRVREQRVKPARDEKILTSWNGLMLRSFAEAARYLKRNDYLQVASKNAEFLLEKLRADGRLLRTYKDGRARLNGYLEDYAFLTDGLLALYETSFQARWFIEARKLIDQAIALFADEQNGGFFDTGSDHEALISRPKDIMDNATPAGNSVAIDVLLRLAAFTGEERYRQRADDYLRPIADVMVQHPQAFGHVLGALDFALSPVKEFAIMGNPSGAESRSLLEVINRRYLPNSVLACADPADIEAVQAVPLLADRPLKEGKPTAYICQNFACLAPVNTAEKLEKLL